MKCFRFLMALLLAGGLFFTHVDASPTTLNNVLTLETGGNQPSSEEKAALKAASDVSEFSYGQLVGKHVRGEAHVNIIDDSHCQVCVETSPGNFIIIDLEEEE